MTEPVTPPGPEQRAREWWRTEIIDMSPGVIRYRGYAVEDLIRARDWRERGFALVRLPDGTLLRDGAALSVGQTVAIQVKGATLDATIDAIHPDPTEGDT